MPLRVDKRGDAILITIIGYPSTFLQAIAPFDVVGNSLETNDMTFEEFEASVFDYSNGALIQNAFPKLDATIRDFLLTGMTPEQQDELYNKIEEN